MLLKKRHYLQYKYFVIRIDHHNLKCLLEQKVTSTIQQKGLTKLLGLDYEVQYKKVVENREVDELSRQHEGIVTAQDSSQTAHLQAISVTVPIRMQEVSASYEGDA